MSLASVLLVILALPLLWVRPGGARPNEAQSSSSQSAIKTIYPTFTTIDVPGAGVTGVYGINSAGDMVGYYGANSNAPHTHGFMLKDGKFTQVDYPHAYATVAYGINDAGLIVGLAELRGGLAQEGFAYDGVTFRRFRDGSDTATRALGINNRNDIVGGSGATIYGTKGFRMRNGHYETINFPGQNVYAYAADINDLGEIVGYTLDGLYSDSYSYTAGQFQNFDVPSAIQTEASGINDKSVVVGWYGVYAGCSCAFAEAQGQYFSFSYPGAAFTAATAINNSGLVVGQYTFDYQTLHGFTANIASNLGLSEKPSSKE